MKRLLTAPLAAAVLAAAPVPAGADAVPPSLAEARAGTDAEPQYVAEARAEATDLMKRLGGELREQLSAGGPEAAIAVCKDRAPAVAGAASRRTGWRITRVSLKVRNPLLGTADAWEQGVLADFDARVAAGERPDALERSEVVDEPQGRTFRYLKAIPMQGMCLQCHGPSEAIPAGVKAVLAAEYPHDRAVGYKPGAVRGGVSIKRRI